MMTVTGSTLLKLGSRGIHFEGAVWGILLSYMTSPALLAGFAAYALGAILWVYCLSQFDLSYVTFVSSFQYVLLLLVSILIFQEQISMMKWVGCGIILVGVYFWLKG
ncbi:EamA family transporter [Paenibacillus hodogayensis]|uniref:EamA family transporter n=1 Tax=Paenibacillus hodogayensis TaxID=279208 RepID=A0ABV5W8C5_9BACL